MEPVINKLFESHQRMNYARYDSTAPLSPMHQEIWAHKTCDNMSVLKTGLAMIEGIYGRDGNGFGIGNDHLTNLVMFSKDKFRLDLIGLYLGGHEPGNIHLYRIAKERGLSDTFNPWDVPVYEWVDGEAVPRKLTDFARTPLKTYYLQKAGRARVSPGERAVRLRPLQTMTSRRAFAGILAAGVAGLAQNRVRFDESAEVFVERAPDRSAA